MQREFRLKPLALTLGLALTRCFAAANAADSEQRLPEVKVRADTETASSIVPVRAGTATKTDTPLSDIPQSIQVVPQALIRDQAAYSVDASIRNVSGVAQSSASNYGFFNNYLVRGLNANFLRDGVPDGLTINGYARTLADVESVEVLKGPGSALYGSGAPGGTINLITRKPRLEPETVIAGTVGSFDTRRVLFDVTGPLGNASAAGRLVADYARSAGYRGLSSEYSEFIPSLQWRPNAHNTVRVNLDYRDLKSTSDTVGIPFRASTIAALNSPKLVEIGRDAKLYTPFANVTQTISRASVNHEMNVTPNVTIRQNLVYLNRDLDLLRNAAGANFTGATTLANRALRDQSDDASELIYQLEPVWKLTFGAAKHTLLTGFEYHRTDIDTRRSQANLAPIQNVFAPIVPEQSKEALLFAPHFDRKLSANQLGVY
ncbi:MAG TPA: TonB-dependent receptor plug domain-containing protein, partial [Burkholderiales bacterium]|nr:TonB-dependent receptor plug domain-containing protein [Burkholderiales bacterium]